jgi:hypothetical protein
MTMLSFNDPAANPLLGKARTPHVPRVQPPVAQPPAATPPAATPPGTNALSPENQALNNFANSAGMQFQLQQGTNALNNMYAARGQLQSGAAMKAIQDYGQNTALQNYFMPYMSLLGGQQAVGAQAGSAVAGVGSSFGNTAANINSNFGNAATGINAGMGGAIGAGADSAANAALARGGVAGQLGSSIGGALGSLGSSFFAPSQYQTGMSAMNNYVGPLQF